GRRAESGVEAGTGRERTTGSGGRQTSGEAPSCGRAPTSASVPRSRISQSPTFVTRVRSGMSARTSTTAGDTGGDAAGRLDARGEDRTEAARGDGRRGGLHLEAREPSSTTERVPLVGTG